MSYDLMVFRPEAAPKPREAFIIWFHEQTKWADDCNYNDISNTSSELNSWFMEMIGFFLH
jgi:hypothetical protein